MPLKSIHNTYILACKIFAPELACLNLPRQHLFYLPSSLHRFPSDLGNEINAKVTELENMEGAERIILVYGYCGGGLKELSSRKLEIVFPLVHDCIPVLVGDLQTAELLKKEGSFFLSPGWIQYSKTPYDEFFEICDKYDEETAKWVCREMLKGYKQVVLIDTLAKVTSTHRAYAQSMAILFGLNYLEIKGNATLMLKLLRFENSVPIVKLKPGEKLNLKLFFS